MGGIECKGGIGFFVDFYVFMVVGLVLGSLNDGLGFGVGEYNGCFVVYFGV